MTTGATGRRDGDRLWLPLVLATTVVLGGLWAMSRLNQPRKSASIPQRVPIAVPQAPRSAPAPTPFVPAPAPAEALQGSASVYRCGPGSGAAYSDRPCAGGGGAVDVRPSSGIQFATPHEVARMQAERRAAIAGELNVSAQPAQQQAAPSNASACRALDNYIAQIDVKTRQPLSSYEQDYWRVERAGAVDRKFGLNCHLQR